MRLPIIIVGLVLSIVAGNAWGVVQYSITDLGTLPGDVTSSATAINASGQVVGCSGDNSSHSNAVLWSGGIINDLGRAEGVFSNATAINASGQIVGTTWYGPSDVRAFSYNGSTMNELGSCVHVAINDSGQIVGSYQYWSGSLGAFIWDGIEPTPENPHVVQLQGDGFCNVAINASGQIVGRDGDCAAFLHVGGSPTVLPSLPGVWSSEANAINAGGQVVGTSWGDEFTCACLWNGDTVTDLTTSGFGDSYTYGINASGEIVGQARSTQKNDYVAFLYSDGAMIDLNSLVDPSLGWSLGSANDINDAGWIVGTGRNPGGLEHAFLLTPVPEPSTVVLLGIGVVGLLFKTGRWRR